MKLERMKIAIIGCALDKYVGDSPGDSEEMGFRVVKRAREMSGIEREEITSVHNSTMDFFDGITISNGILAPAAGGYNRDSTRIQNGGLFGILSACASIMSGDSEIAVVSSADSVVYDMLKVTQASTHYFLERPLGLNHVMAYAMFSNAYMEKYGIEERDIAEVAAKNYTAGSMNKYAHIKDDYSIDDVMDSSMISYPLKSREVALMQSYGGAALILTSEEKAKKYTDSPIWITGLGVSTNSVNFEALTEMSALKLASGYAYKMAGIKNPGKEIGTAEINSPFSLFELAAYEAMGLCEEGKSIKLLRDGVTSIDGELPVNPSGGTLCTNAPNSNGLFRSVQAVMYLNKGKGNGRGKALVHDSDMSIGLAGDSHAIMILEKEG